VRVSVCSSVEKSLASSTNMNPSWELKHKI